MHTQCWLLLRKSFPLILRLKPVCSNSKQTSTRACEFYKPRFCPITPSRIQLGLRLPLFISRLPILTQGLKWCKDYTHCRFYLKGEENIGLPSWKCQKGKAILAQLSNNLAKVKVFTLEITGQLTSIKVKNDLNVSLPLKEWVSQSIINTTLIFATYLHYAWSEKALHKGI